MKGHIRERSPGHWAIVLDVRDPSHGETKAEMAFISRDQAPITERERAADFGTQRRDVSGAEQDCGGPVPRPVARRHQVQSRSPHT